MSAGKINQHMNILTALYPDKEPQFANEDELYATIDSTKLEDALWKSFEVEYTGEIEDNVAPWKTATYEVWHHDVLQVMEMQIDNPDFAKEIDYAPKRVYKNAKQQYTDLMSGNWAWEQVVRLHCIVLAVHIANNITAGPDCTRS